MKKIMFYLLTDSHYVSKKNWVEGEPFTSRERSDQIALKASPEILDAFLDKVIADPDVETVLFTGDNVNNGDYTSHYEFRERLEKLAKAGKTVLVTTATHDYCGQGDDENFFSACRYTETGTEPIPAMHKSELFDFYFDYGPKQAHSVHRESGSYAVILENKVRLIAINDNGNGRSHCGLFEDGVKWLTEQIREANAAGEFVVLAVHHPVLPPWEIFRHMADYEVYGGYQELYRLMCDEGVRVVFTGHTHIQNIRKYTDEAGRWFLDISTIALVNAAGKMRRVEIDPESGVCEVTSVGIDDAPGVDTQGKSLYEYLYELNMPGIVEKLLPLAKTDFAAFLREGRGCLPVEKLEKHKTAVRAAIRFLTNLKLSSLARFGKKYNGLSRTERTALKEKKAIDALYVILRHVYAGNAPFTPDTDEYKTLMGVVRRVDRLVEKYHVKKVQDMIPPGSDLAEVAEDFLYNNRTGDDDAITFSLR